MYDYMQWGVLLEPLTISSWNVLYSKIQWSLQRRGLSVLPSQGTLHRLEPKNKSEDAILSRYQNKPSIQTLQSQDDECSVRVLLHDCCFPVCESPIPDLELDAFVPKANLKCLEPIGIKKWGGQQLNKVILLWFRQKKGNNQKYL